MKNLVLSVSAIAAFAGIVPQASARRVAAPIPWECHIEVKNLRGQDNAGFVRVTDVRVLRSANPILDREAIAAVRQWRYTPIVLNGIPVKFLLTVTLSFQLEERK